MKKIAIIIPCYNEEKAIGKVIDAIPRTRLAHLGFETEVIVVDNESTDKTYHIAKNRDVTILSEKFPGKGRALLRAFNYLQKDIHYVVMLDGDNTYKAYEIPRLIEPLDSGFCDVIVGSRLGGKINKNSLEFSNRIVNWSYAFLVRVLYQANITDVLSGFFAWKREVIDILKPQLQSDGFAIEMEMITKIVKLGFEIYSVPITYDQREGESKIDKIKDGLKISYMLVKNLTWKPKRHVHPRKSDRTEAENFNLNLNT